MKNIYYGIQGEFAKKNINNWINITGAPEAFVVKDEKLLNFKTGFQGYDVISLGEALNRYPGAEIWITYNNNKDAKSAASDILTKVKPERIHFLEVNLEYRKGCNRLGRSLHYETKRIPMCTVGNRSRPMMYTKGSVTDIIAEWQEYSKKLILANQLESPNKCYGCPLMKYGFYDTPGLRNLRFLQSLRDDACNLKCTYCSAAQSDKFAANKNKEGPSVYDVIYAFSQMTEFVNMGKDFTITFANGELCANKHFDLIIDILLANKWQIELLSNLSIYREKLADFIHTGRVVKIITSIDAGTRETYKKIKKNDRFDVVVENLKKYPLHKTKFFLKYLFLEGINDNEADIDGFYELAKESGAVIDISTDNKTNTKPFTENKRMRELVLRLIKKAKSDGIKVIADENNINPIDVRFIAENYAKA